MSASSMMMTMASTTTAPQRHGVGVRRTATPSTSFNNLVRSAAGGKRLLHHHGSRARPRCDAAAGDGGAAGEQDDELFDGDLIANNAASVNGKLRTLVVGITDEQGEAGPGSVQRPWPHRFARLIIERYPSPPTRGVSLSSRRRRRRP